MLIEKEQKIEMFTETSIQKLRPMFTGKDRVMFPCPHCGTGVYFPIVARKHDIETFKRLIEIAEIYLKEEGVLERILTTITDRINLQLLINKVIKE